MGRPPTKPKKLKDGFYIEVRNKGSQTGIKIRRDSKEQVMQSGRDYAKTKNVIYLGELISGKWQSSPKKIERK